jgi:hypothetical protein
LTLLSAGVPPALPRHRARPDAASSPPPLNEAASPGAAALDDGQAATGRCQMPVSYQSVSGQQEFFFVAGK